MVKPEPRRNFAEELMAALRKAFPDLKKKQREWWKHRRFKELQIGVLNAEH